MKPSLNQQKLNELGQKGIRDNDQIHNAYNNLLMLRDEANQQRMENFPYENDEQMSHWLGVKHQPDTFFWCKKYTLLSTFMVEQMVGGWAPTIQATSYFRWGEIVALVVKEGHDVRWLFFPPNVWSRGAWG